MRLPFEFTLRMTPRQLTNVGQHKRTGCGEGSSSDEKRDLVVLTRRGVL